MIMQQMPLPPDIPPGVMEVARNFFIMIAVIALGIPIIRAFTRRFERGPSSPQVAPPDVIARMQAIARKAHEALQLSVYSRTDFIYAEGRPAGSDLFVLETNNLPGFTPTSLLPQAAAHAGLSYSGLLTKVIEESLARGR